MYLNWEIVKQLFCHWLNGVVYIKKIPSSYVPSQFCIVSEIYDAYRYEKPENVYTNVFYFALKQITVWWSIQLKCAAYFIEESEH
jgi:hypothetical protein